MHVALLALAFQLHAPALSAVAQRSSERTPSDSARDLSRARGAQANFERSRRAHLPFGDRGNGRCDVRLGRYCWWYDEHVPTFPPEEAAIGERRQELLAQLDLAAAHYPGDDWLAGMRVHYRVDGHQFAAADSVAGECRATGWWCSALAGYAAHSGGDAHRADSAFALAVAGLPAEESCSWRDIAPLLSDGDRDVYEHRSCDARRALETRYWLLSRPQFSTGGNEWQNEFNVRRVLNWLGERAATPHLLSWGKDAAELVLRYGWPTAWSRTVTAMGSMQEPGIIGHDPAPSFSFAPSGWLADSLKPLPPDAWDLSAPRAEARYAPPMVKRVASVAAQFARFRRGDSTLLVAAFAAQDDSLRTLVARLGAAGVDGITALSEPDTAHVGRTRVMLGTTPWIVGIDVADTTTRTLARTRRAFVPGADSARLSLSDLLVYRAGEDPAPSLDSALVRAVPGDTVTRDRALGIFWETYGLSSEGETVDIAVSVERVDHGWIRSARQKLGLTPMDTPIRIKWSDARTSVGKAAAHAISLDLANLDAGRYRLTLTLVPASGVPVAALREVELIDR
ncbi:MAG: hypothetical protein ABIT20_00340 [Gemmatimonadaceae bacterium]